MPRHFERLFVREAVLLEHVGHLGLGLAGTLVDLLALLHDLRVEDLALALAADVLAGSHAEDSGQPRRDACHQHRIAVRRRAGDGAHHRKRADQTVLRAEDRLANLAQQT